MSFERPALKDLVERISSDAESRLSVPQLRRSNAKVYSRVLAGASHGLHGHIEWLAKQLFVDTADSDFLDRWASIYAIQRKKATKASGSVAITFASEIVPIPVGSLMQTDDGVQFETIDGVTRDKKVRVRALLTGETGNVVKGDVLTLSNPIAGVMSEVTVEGISGGANAEDDESLRTRLLFRMQEQPHGGAKSDYVAWALEVPGVTRAWCYPNEGGVGKVTVRFVCDDLENIVPTPEMVEKVDSHIEEKRPVTADVTIKAPTLKPVAITIESLSPDTTAVREAVKKELQDLFIRESEPGKTVLVSHIRAAISYAIGEEDHQLVAPLDNPEATANELLTLGDITWQ